MQKTLDFWFDFGSPYGYFMAEKLGPIAARHGYTVRWRPILLFAVLRSLELPAPMGTQVKRDYLMRDMARTAHYLQLPFRFPEGPFPALSQHACRAFYLLQRLDPMVAQRFAMNALRGHFQQGCGYGLEQVAQWVRESAPQGQAEEVIQALGSDDARALAAQAIDEAIAQGIFGSPFVVIGTERFFGVDRLPHIEALLAGEVDFSSAAAVPAAQV